MASGTPARTGSQRAHHHAGRTGAGGRRRQPLGLGGKRALISVELFDLATGARRQLRLARNRTDHEAVAMGSGDVLLVGGRSDFILSKWNLRWAKRLRLPRRWRRAASRPLRRRGSAANDEGPPLVPLLWHQMTELSRSVRIPGDHGLPGLGLMMQLVSGLEALVVISMALAILQVPANANPVTWGLMAITLVRAFVCFVAGMEIRAGGMKIPSRVRALLVVSVVHFGMLLWPYGAEIDRIQLWACAETLMWPGLLFALLHTPAWRKRFEQLREGELELRDPNRSIEAVGGLIVVLGTTGVILTGAILWFLVEATPSTDPPAVPIGPYGAYGSHPPFITFFPWFSVAAGVMLVRGLVHVVVGVRALAGATPEVFSRYVSRYVRLHWLTVVVAVAPVAVAFSERVPHMGVLAFGIATTLSVWPMVLRGFANQVAGDFGEQEAPDFARAPDGGLATVGWLLCALGISSLVPAGLALLGGTRSYSGLQPLTTLSWFEVDGLPMGLGVLGVAITLWAGLEMIRLTPRARVAALSFAAFTLAMTLWARLGWLTSGNVGALESHGIPASFVLVTTLYRAQVLLSLVVPLVVAFLALRRPPSR